VIFGNVPNPLDGDANARTPIVLRPMTWLIVAGVMFAAYWLLQRASRR
jgi:hypothetical protein